MTIEDLTPRVPLLFRAMVAFLSLGLAGALALGFGAQVPPWAVTGCIGVGTLAMAALFAVLIGASISSRNPPKTIGNPEGEER